MCTCTETDLLICLHKLKFVEQNSYQNYKFKTKQNALIGMDKA